METLGRFGVQGLGSEGFEAAAPGSQEWTLLSENRGGLKLHEVSP